jgi:carboxyl-terminal processing protease
VIKKKSYLFVSLGILLLFTGFFVSNSDIYLQIAKNIDLFSKVYKEITFNYVDEIEPEQFIRSGIKGMLETLDPYTVFVDEKRKDDIELITRGKYGGIGVSIGIRAGSVSITEIMEGYSAQRQGLRIGDVILKVGDTEISTENFDEISTFVKGEPGTTLEMTIKRDKKENITFNLVREEIIIKNLIYAGFVPENSNSVYLKLTGFSRTAANEVIRALTDLNKQRKIESVILDLRGNPGGLLDAAIDISDAFLKKGELIVSTRGRDFKSTKNYISQKDPLVKDAKVIVLVNENSASASEIVAGALQDHDRGIILGTETFGKGLVQTITPLSFNTSLKITTAKYYTPSGRSIQKLDYLEKNKVLPLAKAIIDDEVFRTDNRRRVYAAGGITPDTVVTSILESNINKELLAKGIIFNFATRFAGSKSYDEYSVFSDDELLNDFFKFIEDEDFKVISSYEKQLDQLITSIEKEIISEEIVKELNSLKSKLEKLKFNELKNYRVELTRELHSDIISRYFGREERTKELLKYDKQFQIANNLINDNFAYEGLLKTH